MILPILAETTGLTTGGWMMMIVSVGSVSTLFCLCLYKVLKGPKQDS